MMRMADRHPFRVGMTSSLAMHIVAALIASYILVYEAPPIDLSTTRPALAVPVILDRPKPSQPEPKPRHKPAMKKAEERQPEPEPEPVAEMPPSSEAMEFSPSPGYLALVRGLLEANKRYPRRAIERGHEGVVVLWFVIDRYGKVINYRIEQSSGSTILDGEVVRLIGKVSKFPMMPDSTVKDSQEITMPIRFVLVDSR
jgi:TonB family protein